MNIDEKSCREFQPIIQDECLFCTKPSLKSASKKEVRIIGKVPINKKYIHRIDRPGDRGYQVAVPIPELGRDKKGHIRCLTAWFNDNKTGGKGKSLIAAIRFRDEAIKEFNLSLESRVIAPSPDVNIYWNEKHQKYDVRIQTKDATISNTFSLKSWIIKEVAYTEAKRWRDTVRADLNLPPAPGAFNTNIVQFEERKQEIIEHRTSLIRASFAEAIEKQREIERVKPNHDGISRTKIRRQAQKESDAWYETVRDHGLHANTTQLYIRKGKHKRF
jgi:hypothetical protein